MAPPSCSTQTPTALRSASAPEPEAASNSVEGRVGGSAAIGALSGLTTCRAVVGAVGFGASARGGAEAVEAGVGGAVAIGALSGLAICGAADGAAGFGA